MPWRGHTSSSLAAAPNRCMTGAHALVLKYSMQCASPFSN